MDIKYKGPLTRSRLDYIVNHMTKGFGNLSEQIEGIEKINYDDPDQRDHFYEEYWRLLQFLYEYFELTGFTPLNSYWEFIQDRMFFFLTMVKIT